MRKKRIPDEKHFCRNSNYLMDEDTNTKYTAVLWHDSIADTLHVRLHFVACATSVGLTNRSKVDHRFSHDRLHYHATT